MGDPLFAYDAPPDPFDACGHPASNERHHGRPTWSLGQEDEVTQVMAAGRDRRAAAAVDAARREANRWHEELPADTEQAWVVIVRTCGTRRGLITDGRLTAAGVLVAYWQGGTE
jgi:hypothetical protein